MNSYEKVSFGLFVCAKFLSMIVYEGYVKNHRHMQQPVKPNYVICPEKKKKKQKKKKKNI